MWFTGGVNPTRRPLVTFLLLVSLLFSQLAVAAYACPGAQSMAAAGSMPEMPDCDMPDSPRDALCQAHCLQGDQSRDTPQASMPAVTLASGPCLLVAGRDPPGNDGWASGFGLDRPIEPPAPIRHCRLHI